MKQNSLRPYIIAGAVVTVLGILIIPFGEMLCYPGTTYAEGFRSVFTYVFALFLGIQFAVFIQRSDRNKDTSSAETDLPDEEKPGSNDEAG